MRVNLAQLLRIHPITESAKFIGFSAGNRSCRLTFRGNSWWKTPHEKEGEISFEFKGLMSGHLDVALFDDLNLDEWEILESFSIHESSSDDWTGHKSRSIYCQGPLPAPLDVYAKVEDFLLSEEAHKGARDFLNFYMNGSIADFVTITQGPAYLVARAPMRICDVVCNELLRQKVPFYVRDESIEPEKKYIVRWEGSNFTCRMAYAEFD